MFENTSLILAQFVLGLVNGSFYAVLSLGLALVFGLLGITNFAHGSLFMLGAYSSWIFLEFCGLEYGWSLILSPLLVGAFCYFIEKVLIQFLYKKEAEYSLLLTFGLSLLIEGGLTQIHGSSGLPFEVPELLQGIYSLGDFVIPYYRIWVLFISCVVCFLVFWLVEKTTLGARLRAIRENSKLCEAFGIDTKKYLTWTFAGAGALAAFAGVLAAPIYQVKPSMGGDFIIVVFAVVVVGGMSSLRGAIFSGFFLGALEGIAKIFLPETSQIVIYLAMALILLFSSAKWQGKEIAS